ncbi:MAG TPA: DUF4105 domain-containing protein [Candidatus Bathyarchaeia archaeon]|nr:DUF4105 domain-containing protein [Candidatus Bathyarchaeia archaeon]
MRLLRGLLCLPLILALVLAIAWAAGALWFDGPAWRVAAGSLAGGLVLLALLLLFAVRPFWRSAVLITFTFLAVLAWWSTIRPSNRRLWQPDVAQVASAEINGDQIRIRNVRNFDYRSETDYTPRWEERTVDLSKLTSTDLFISFWGPTAIAHTILSFEFSDGRPLAFSVETRKKEGDSYSAIRGFFKQYELIYIVADERDVVRLRTNYRGETVYLYRLKTPPDRAREVLLNYLQEVNRLARSPEFYNALTDNCTTNVRVHFQAVGGNVPLDWRILLNGYLDEFLYERGAIDTRLPFAELKSRSNIDPAARAADQDPAFSERIRQGLPEFQHAQ